jgi:hypothetical protein
MLSPPATASHMWEGRQPQATGRDGSRSERSARAGAELIFHRCFGLPVSLTRTTQTVRLVSLHRLSAPVTSVSTNAGGAEPAQVGRETCTGSTWGGHGRGGPAVEACVVKNGGAWGRAIQPRRATLPGAASFAMSRSGRPLRRAALYAVAPRHARQVPLRFGAPTGRSITAGTKETGKQSRNTVSRPFLRAHEEGASVSRASMGGRERSSPPPPTSASDTYRQEQKDICRSV